MKRRDRRHWREPTDITGLGQKTALWLEGEIGETPNYLGPPDDETKGIAPVLAKLNRSGGIVTYGSQPEFDGTGYDGAHWRQMAAIELLADPNVAPGLVKAAAREGFLVVDYAPPLPRRKNGYAEAVNVTARHEPDWPKSDRGDWGAWEVTTDFGCKLSQDTLRTYVFGAGCSRAAQDAAGQAYQVTIVDWREFDEWPQESAPDRLWRWLDAWAGQRTSPSQQEDKG
jgi:hypothetical protein